MVMMTLHTLINPSNASSTFLNWLARDWTANLVAVVQLS
jgi:hypothetical protein